MISKKYSVCIFIIGLDEDTDRKFLRNPNLNKIKLQYDWTGNGDLIIIPYGILLDLPHSNNEKGEVSEYIYNFN